LREPLNPHVPALAQHNVSPRVSVIVTWVLLNVALTNAIAVVTLRRTLRRLLFASDLDCCFATIYLVFVFLALFEAFSASRESSCKTPLQAPLPRIDSLPTISMQGPCFD